MASSGTGKNKEIANLAQEIQDIDAENLKRLQTMARFEDLKNQGRVTQEQIKSILAVKDQYMKETERRTEVQTRMENVKQEQLEASLGNSMILCKNRVHVGTQITFGPITMTVQNSFVNSRIMVVDGDLKVLTQ
jgi:hypothetical protein